MTTCGTGEETASPQFSVHFGGAGGNGTSPARASVDRLNASREIANSLFIFLGSVDKW